MFEYQLVDSQEFELFSPEWQTSPTTGVVMSGVILAPTSRVNHSTELPLFLDNLPYCGLDPLRTEYKKHRISKLFEILTLSSFINEQFFMPWFKPAGGFYEL